MTELYPNGGDYYIVMMFVWGILAVVNLLVSGVRLVMKMQEKKFSLGD